MTQSTDIKTLKDGSIDYAHYIAKSHGIRSNEAHGALSFIWQMLKKLTRTQKMCSIRHTAPGRPAMARYPVERLAPRPIPHRAHTQSLGTTGAKARRSAAR